MYVPLFLIYWLSVDATNLLEFTALMRRLGKSCISVVSLFLLTLPERSYDAFDVNVLQSDTWGPVLVLLSQSSVCLPLAIKAAIMFDYCRNKFENSLTAKLLRACTICN